MSNKPPLPTLPALPAGDDSDNEGLDEPLTPPSQTTKLRWVELMASGETFSERYVHSCAAIGSRVYVFGGYGSGRYFNDLYVLDMGNNFGKKVDNSRSHSCFNFRK